uniref:Uncharacterized protein n=1 Tax=Arcella intermedia TaxID=1963864 RepID=A0A6B2KY81_9EUKA
MSKIRDIYEPEIFLESLNIVSCLEGYEQDIAKTGAVRATILMMNRDIHNPRSQILGCKVLANLAHDLEVCKWVGKVKGIQRLLETLKRHLDAPDVVVEVCRTLANLAFRCKYNKEIMISEKALESLVSAITIDKSNEKVVNAGLRAIRNIVSECKDNFIEETLLDQVMDSMSSFPQGLDIQINGIWIIVNLMSSKIEVKKRVVDKGALEHIFNGMQNYESDPHVQLAGSTAIALVAKVANYRPLIAKKGGLQLLNLALRTHRQIVPIQRSVIKALFRLSFNEQNRNKIVEMKILNEIFESMKLNSNSGPLQRICLLFLLELAKTPKIKEIIQTKAVSLIIQARNKYSDVPHIHRVATIAVEVIISSSPNATLSAPGSPASPLAPKTAALREEVNTKENETLQSEHKLLQQKLSEKDDIISKVQTQISTLENVLARLKAEENEETLAGVYEKIAIKKEIAKLKFVKANIGKDLKRIQSETQEIQSTFESHGHDDKIKPKDSKSSSSGDVRKAKILPNTTAEPKKPEKKDNAVASKEAPKKNPAKPHSKKGTKDSGKQKTAQKGKTTKGKPRFHEKSNENGEDNMEQDEEPSGLQPPQLLPHQKSSLRTFNRNLTNNSAVSEEDIAQIQKKIEEILLQLAEKDKEVEETEHQRAEIEAQVNKLEMDLKGTHILIQTLQKESLNQTQNREKLVTGNSFFTRHQKKMKSIKDEIAALSTENEELKKEIAALSDTPQNTNNPTAPTNTTNTNPAQHPEKASSKKKKKH